MRETEYQNKVEVKSMQKKRTREMQNNELKTGKKK
jgi:hypothetical protein